MSSNGRFVNGQAPWNKGLSGYSPAGAEAGRFQPGRKSHRWMPVGTVKTNAHDGYLEQKVADTGQRRTDWQKVHKLVWEAANGPIPPGHSIRFRDGCKTNVSLANLELQTLAEAMQRNSINRLPPELQEVIRLKQRLTRKINEHDR